VEGARMPSAVAGGAPRSGVTRCGLCSVRDAGLRHGDRRLAIRCRTDHQDGSR
jgi:hypothetical protein